MTVDLPSAGLLSQQAAWLAPGRARLLRRVAVARRRRVLDLGAGYGTVTGELVRRSGGAVVAVDSKQTALSHDPDSFAGAGRVCGTAAKLPFEDAAFDLVFCQVVLMWVSLAEAVREIWRVLLAGGVLVALEPDYGGLIEHPPELATRDLWLAALSRVGADPLVGRKLPGVLTAQGFAVRVDLLSELVPPSPLRFDLLRGLPLTREEQQILETVESEAAHRSGAWGQVVHLPFVLVTATKNSSQFTIQNS